MIKRLALLLLALPTALMAQTQTGFVGDTFMVKRVMPAAGPGCYRDELLSKTGSFIGARDTLCWAVRPIPPVVVDTPKPAVVVVPGRPAPLFDADWSTATGNSQQALRDMSKALPFDQCEGSAPVTIVAATGLGFPAKMANVMRVTRNNQDTWYFCRIGASGSTLIPHWPQLAIGQAHYWRVYLRVDIPNSEGQKTGSSFHPIQMPHNTNDHFEPINFHSDTNSTMAMDAFVGTLTNPWPFNQWSFGKFIASGPQAGFYSSQHLPKFTVLRVEWMYRRDAVGYSAGYRIYDASNVLLWSEDGVGAKYGAVMSVNNGQQTTMKAYDGKFLVGNPAWLQSLSVGVNGGPHDYRQDVYFYMGGLKLCADTWCGPY